MTTKTLQSLIDKATALPAELQDQFAKEWLAELEDDQLWDEKFARSAHVIDSLAEKALEARKQGKTIKKGIDEL